jgi:anti-sigma regulatory factor (Ser/Thr protein kinase)
MTGADGPGESASPARVSGPALPARWPRQSFLELGALPSAVPCARLHAIAVVREWGMGILADAAQLVVSELMTNAVRVSSARPAGASAGLPAVGLRLSADQRQLLVEVSDNDPSPPVPAGVDPERDGGRGLLLVASASAQWGYYYPAPQPGRPASQELYHAAPASGGWAEGAATGKTVWALLPAP